MWLSAVERIRRLPKLWRKTGAALTGVLLFELGARVGLPNLDGRVLGDFLRGGGGGGLLTLFDRLVGGALSRGAVLALGIMPYISARIIVRLARVTTPSLDEAGHTKLTRWTRVLTVGLGLVQSYGFARFVQTVPGAVARPGVGFIVETMVVLTTGAVCAMLLTEQLTKRDEDLPLSDEDQVVRETEEQVRVEGLSQPVRDELLLPPGQLPGLDAYQPRRDAVGARQRRSS